MEVCPPAIQCRSVSLPRVGCNATAEMGGRYRDASGHLRDHEVGCMNFLSRRQHSGQFWILFRLQLSQSTGASFVIEIPVHSSHNGHLLGRSDRITI